jgi:hypothetical protein
MPASGVAAAGTWFTNGPGNNLANRSSGLDSVIHHRLGDLFASQPAGGKLRVGQLRQDLEALRQLAGLLNAFHKRGETLADPL